MAKELSEQMKELNKKNKYKPRTDGYKKKAKKWREMEAKNHAEGKSDPLEGINEHARN